MLGQVMQANGSVVRAESEFNLLTNENKKRLRAESTLATARTSEKDGRASEAEQSIKKRDDLVFQVGSAEMAEEAAKLAIVSAAVGAAAGIFGALGDTFSVITAAIQGFFNVLGAVFAYLGAQAEAEMLNKQFGHISAEANQDKQMVAGMDGNPAL